MLHQIPEKENNREVEADMHVRAGRAEWFESLAADCSELQGIPNSEVGGIHFKDNQTGKIYPLFRSA